MIILLFLQKILKYRVGRLQLINKLAAIGYLCITVVSSAKIEPQELMK